MLLSQYRIRHLVHLIVTVFKNCCFQVRGLKEEDQGKLEIVRNDNFQNL